MSSLPSNCAPESRGVAQDATDAADERIARLERRWQRERSARLAAEELLETKARELYTLNEELRHLASDLENRVEERTHQLEEAWARAVAEANHDALTGLLNRRRHAELLEQCIGSARAEGGKVALLTLDLDHFKEVNDTYGHGAGDAVLREIAARLRNEVPEGYAVARLGGDEFSIIAPDLVCGADILAFAGSILDLLNVPILYAGHELRLCGSIGVALFPEHGLDAASLLRNADIALYNSKESGRGNFVLFDGAMYLGILDRQALEEEVRRGMQSRAFVPWFQPICNFETGKTCGVEALARWQRRNGDLAAPGVFLGAIEACGLMSALLDTMLDQSLSAMAPSVRGGQIGYVAINVAAAEFTSGTIVERVMSAMERSAFPAAGLVLEITEEALISDFAKASHAIEQLQALGVRIAIDDFGSGYANIAYLSNLKIDILKLDRSLTRDLAGNQRAGAIIFALSGLARALGVDLVAEGVETEIQAIALRLAGCALMQGYLFSRPLPISALIGELEETKIRFHAR
jgi:diguanylate cyclase (GGDEF)-like protein